MVTHGRSSGPDQADCRVARRLAEIMRFHRVSERLNPAGSSPTPQPGSRLHICLPDVRASLMLWLYSRYIPLTFLLVLLR